MWSKICGYKCLNCKKKEYLNFHFKVLFQKSILKKSTQNYSQAKKIKISVDISEIETVEEIRSDYMKDNKIDGPVYKLCMWKKDTDHRN